MFGTLTSILFSGYVLLTTLGPTAVYVSWAGWAVWVSLAIAGLSITVGWLFSIQRTVSALHLWRKAAMRLEEAFPTPTWALSGAPHLYQPVTLHYTRFHLGEAAEALLPSLPPKTRYGKFLESVSPLAIWQLIPVIFTGLWIVALFFPFTRMP
jgi:hypothetical protein